MVLMKAASSRPKINIE